MKLLGYWGIASLAAGAIALTGCSHTSPTPAASVSASAPELTPQQQIQQIQNDSTLSPDVKAVRLKAAQARLGPDTAHYSHVPPAPSPSTP